MKLEDEIDALFRLPVAEFTGARNALAARLKKEGHHNESDRVKLLAKPSVSAWAVNQLYWNHRKAFDELIATSKRFRTAGMRDSLDARRDALVHLSELATELLSDAGHNPSLETLRHITTTLEALSAYALLPDGPTPGRLTHDVDPPSFESLASLMSGAVKVDKTKKPAPVAKQTSAPAAEVRQIRQARIAAAKVALQEAKRALADARATAQGLEVAQKEAHAELKQAEERLKHATTASVEAAKAMEDAKHTVEAATKELESLLRQS